MSLILSGTDGVADVDGSAATPAIRGTDANTGIFFPAADTIAFAEGGAEVARFDASGNLGVGTTAPANYGTAFIRNISAVLADQNVTVGAYFQAGVDQFGFINSGTVNNAGPSALVFQTGGIERARIDSSGNVGIGTSSPASKLEVSTSTSTEIRSTITGSAGNVARFRLKSPVADYAWYVADNINALVAYDYNAGAERARIDSSGNLLVGTTSGSGARLRVQKVAGTSDAIAINLDSGGAGISFAGSASTATMLYFATTSGFAGQVTCSGTTTSYVTLSDYRLKENIASMTGALEKVTQLKPVTYKWKLDGSDGQGFIAHELQAVVPECVVGEKDAIDADGNPKYQGFDASFLVATLTAALQEAHGLITALTARVEALEGAQK